MPSNIIECCLGGDRLGLPVDSANPAGVQIDLSEKAVNFNVDRKPGVPKKQFVARESVLTELFSTSHGASFYRMCVIFSLLAVLSSLVADYADNVPLDIGQYVVWRNLKDIPMTVVIWLFMATLVMIAYGVLRMWASHRDKVPHHGRWLYDLFFGTTWMIICISFLTLPSIGIIVFDMGPVCTLSVLMELVRFSMKGYSITRICTSRVVRQCGGMPSLGHFLYFNVVPTGIYCDEYPRTNKRNWKKIAVHVLELAWCGIMFTFIISRIHNPGLANFRSIWLDTWPLLASFAVTAVPSGIAFIIIFYGYFHCFLNIQAELTGFADRLFYKDWWTVETYSEYFRTWNTIIQDWLFVHVYRDVRKFTDNRLIANIAVFTVSGIMHEYVFSILFRFFYPVMSVVFGMIGFTLAVVPSFTLGNTGVWITFPLGAGVIITSYFSEYFARINCPYAEGNVTTADYFIPRSWACPMT